MKEKTKNSQANVADSVIASEKMQTSSSLGQLVKSTNMLLEIFAFLSGSIIVHKIGLVSKRIRKILEIKGPLSDHREVKIKDRHAVWLFIFMRKIRNEEGEKKLAMA
jgi:hypothetical protein